MIIFSQAPADIQYILFLYDKYKDLHKIKIIVVNVENNYKFFKSLQLNVELEFIPIVAQKNIFVYIWFTLKLKLLFNKVYSNIKDTNIYFFSRNYDYVTAFFIEKLYRKNNVHFVDIYKQEYIKKNNMLNNIKKEIMYYLLGIKVYFDEYSYVYILNQSITLEHMVVENKDIEKYKYKISLKKNNKKNLLLYESNSGLCEWFVDYNKDLISIVDKMSNDYNIYIKPHPRLGYSKCLERFDFKFIDEYIPSELLSLNNIDILFGIESTAIATSKFKNKFSLVNLFGYADLERKQYIINYLSNLSNDNLVFLQSLDDI